MLCEFSLYSKVDQPYVHIYPLFFVFPSHLGHPKALSRVPCAIQQVLINYLFYTQQCEYVNPNLPVHHISPPPNTQYPYTHSLCLSFGFANKFIFIIFLVSTYKQYYLLLAFLFQTYFFLYDSLQVPPHLCKLHNLIPFLWLSNIPFSVVFFFHLVKGVLKLVITLHFFISIYNMVSIG